jgi:hypothetical protein
MFEAISKFCPNFTCGASIPDQSLLPGMKEDDDEKTSKDQTLPITMVTAHTTPSKPPKIRGSLERSFLWGFTAELLLSCNPNCALIAGALAVVANLVQGVALDILKEITPLETFTFLDRQVWGYGFPSIVTTLFAMVMNFNPIYYQGNFFWVT